MLIEDLQTITNEQVDTILEKYPLLAKGYDALPCPNCDVLCFPQREYANGTVRYNTHMCTHPILTWNMPQAKSFSILVNGDLKE